MAVSKWQSGASSLSTTTDLTLLRSAAADCVFLRVRPGLKSDSLGTVLTSVGVGGGSFRIQESQRRISSLSPSDMRYLSIGKKYTVFDL